MKYYIKRVLNNNIVEVEETSKGLEYILLGKGIGFKKHQGDLVENDYIEKVYTISDEKSLSKYKELLNNSDENTVMVVEDIIFEVAKEFGSNYDEYLHIALLDHINFSIYRLKNQIEMQNIFLEELKIMYEREFTFATKMLAMVNNRLAIELPSSEIGFITMHVHSAIKNKKISKTAFYTQVIGFAMQYIENQLQLKLDANSIERARLVTHLKFALERASKNISIHNPLNKQLIASYPKTLALATSLADELNKNFQVELPDGEIGYLVLHIANIIYSSKGEIC